MSIKSIHMWINSIHISTQCTCQSTLSICQSFQSTCQSINQSTCQSIQAICQSILQSSISTRLQVHTTFQNDTLMSQCVTLLAWALLCSCRGYNLQLTSNVASATKNRNLQPSRPFWPHIFGPSLACVTEDWCLALHADFCTCCVHTLLKRHTLKLCHHLQIMN